MNITFPVELFVQLINNESPIVTRACIGSPSNVTKNSIFSPSKASVGPNISKTPVAFTGVILNEDNSIEIMIIFEKCFLLIESIPPGGQIF